MSGIEVAGLLLAVIPLFVSAAEHYRQGLDAGKRCWNKDRILRQYRVELEFQRVYLVLNLKALLVDVDLEFAEKEALVGGADTGDETSTSVPALKASWERPHIKAKLIQRLGEAHNSFVSILQRVSQALLGQIIKHKDLRDTTDIKESTPVDCSLRLRMFHDKIKSATGLIDARALWKCVKFSWQNTERNQMIIDLQDNNDKLQILLRLLQAAKPFYAEQRSDPLKDILCVRDQARRMFQVLSQHYSCSHPAHQVKLNLKRGHYRQQLPGDACFVTILHQTTSIPWPITVRIVSAPAQKDTQRVRIAIGDDENDHVWYTRQRRALADLCHALSAASPDLSLFDLVIDEESKLWQVIPPSNALPVPAPHIYSLEMLLTAAALHRKEPKWLAREKRILSVILCHSLLHLEGTEWLNRGWDAENLIFVQEQELPIAKAPRFRLTQPYVCADIRTTEGSLTVRSQDLSVDDSHGHPINSLLDLGIVLLELYLNGPLESAEDTQPATNIQLRAMGVLGSCREDKDMDPPYYNAIQFCLWPPWPPTGICSFENANFRDDYYQKVVAPFEAALTEGFDFTKEEMAAL